MLKPAPQETTHRVIIGDARVLPIADASVHLVVTSPPYPMIAMWDDAFCALDPAVAGMMEREEGLVAFGAMHRVLDTVWEEAARVLVPGGICCVNIGDATRSMGGEFALYPNHARVIAAMLKLGMTVLPDILWRKPTNAPNKFMGSGMLPGGAYVTYEHEYILVFRKGGKRLFVDEEKVRRAQSAYFWEERNVWFSDVWMGLTGTQQKGTEGGRERSGAFPFEVPYRLIQMYAMQGDTVLDPFVGTGTTMAAALASGRNSIGVERLQAFEPVILETLERAVEAGQTRAEQRIAAHIAFVEARVAAGKVPGHTAANYGFPVITGQESTIWLAMPDEVVTGPEGVTASYSDATDPAAADGAAPDPAAAKATRASAKAARAAAKATTDAAKAIRAAAKAKTAAAKTAAAKAKTPAAGDAPAPQGESQQRLFGG